jgi:hypothetical protein
MALDLKFEDGTLLRLHEPPDERGPGITLQPGTGRHKLTVRFVLEVLNRAPGCTQVQFEGEIYAHHLGLRWIGDITPLTEGFVSFRHPVSLTVPLDDSQVLQLEEDRNGGELLLNVKLRGVLPQSTVYPISQTEGDRRLSASAWEKQIEGLGRAVSITITVPLPMDGGPLAEAAQHLRTADQQLTAGEFKDSIRETRLAVDKMRELGVWPKAGAKKLKERDQGDRYGLLLDHLDSFDQDCANLLQALHDQASGPQHDDGALRGASWLRPDAVTMLGTAASLMYRMAHQIRR